MIRLMADSFHHPFRFEIYQFCAKVIIIVFSHFFYQKVIVYFKNMTLIGLNNIVAFHDIEHFIVFSIFLLYNFKNLKLIFNGIGKNKKTILINSFEFDNFNGFLYFPQIFSNGIFYCDCFDSKLVFGIQIEIIKGDWRININIFSTPHGQPRSLINLANVNLCIVLFNLPGVGI